MTYNELMATLDAMPGMPFARMTRAKASTTMMVLVGPEGNRGFATLESLELQGISRADIEEHFPHCIATVDTWRKRTAAAVDGEYLVKMTQVGGMSEWGGTVSYVSLWRHLETANTQFRNDEAQAQWFDRETAEQCKAALAQYPSFRHCAFDVVPVSEL